MTRRSRPGVERTDSYNSLGLLNKGTLARASVTSGDGVSAVLSRRSSYAPSRDEAADDAANDASQEALRDIEPELAIRFKVESEIQSLSSLDELLLPVGIADYTFVKEEAGGLLGKGKFSAVWIARKGDKEVAIKHTPLFRHHPLIATRLLREPTILAQLPAHRNLIKVSEMIRTPGHFYLVEEYFPNYINLEDFVALRCPQGRLSETQAYTVLYQLVDVVRSALHRPIFIAHRDIKPENILIHPKTLHVLILDFGLATHFSGSEPRLTTCCGSPAFHSPELWLSLKSPPGSVRYWGPEVDVWCIGVSMLRCLVGKRCPLGTSHSSLQDLSDKVIDTVLTIPHQELRNIIASLLDMNGDKRMEHFVELAIPSSPERTADAPTAVRDFKSTTFVPTTAKHSLHLPIEQLSPPTTRARTLSGADMSRSTSRPGSIAADKTALGSSTCSLTLVNPDQQPATSVVSFIKYALRCSGVLYHVLPDNQASASFSALPTPDFGPTQDKETDRFSSAFQQPSLTSRPIYLHCVMASPESDPTAMEQRKRPGLLRAYTAGTRPVSMPPSTDRSTKANAAAAKDKMISCLQFWMSMVLEEDTSKRRKKKRTVQKNDFSSIIPSRITIRVSDKRAFNTVRSALELGKSASSRHGSPSSTTMPLQDSDRGRPAHRRGVSSTGDSTASDSPTSLSEPPPRGKSVDALNLYRSSAKEDAEERDKPSVVGNLLESARKGIGSISRSASKLRISDMGQEEDDEHADWQLSMKQQKDQQAQYHQAAVFM